jgi:hypothetical protein
MAKSGSVIDDAIAIINGKIADLERAKEILISASIVTDFVDVAATKPARGRPKGSKRKSGLPTEGIAQPNVDGL